MAKVDLSVELLASHGISYADFFLYGPAVKTSFNTSAVENPIKRNLRAVWIAVFAGLD